MNEYQRQFICCACGEDFQEDGVEQVFVGMEAKIDFMCRRCYRLNFDEDEEEEDGESYYDEFDDVHYQMRG